VTDRVGTALSLLFGATAAGLGVTAVAWALAAQSFVYFVAVWTLETQTSTTLVGNVAAQMPGALELSGGRR
jgi:hypothetical protein